MHFGFSSSSPYLQIAHNYVNLGRNYRAKRSILLLKTAKTIYSHWAGALASTLATSNRGILGQSDRHCQQASFARANAS